MVFTMNKVKLLTIVSIVLILINISIIVFYFYGDNKLPRKQNKEVIIKRLKFDDNQITEYEKLIQWHRTSITECERDIRDLKMSLYSTLNNENEDDNYLIYIALRGLQDNIEHIHYKHFQDIRKLCRADQKILFDELSKELFNLFGPPLKPRHDIESKMYDGKPHRPTHDRPDREPPR